MIRYQSVISLILLLMCHVINSQTNFVDPYCFLNPCRKLKLATWSMILSCLIMKVNLEEEKEEKEAKEEPAIAFSPLCLNCCYH
uniref:Uncharacterized protein n=1 Tax=Rhizophora mucronata TaxID=61149 RepID=A0A2P2ILB2_RHIMU